MEKAHVLFRPGKNPETGMWELTGSPFFFFDEKADRWFVYFNFIAYDRRRSWDTPTLLRRAGAKIKGVAGINGEFDYPGEIVAPSGIAHPTDAAASSISPPFQGADEGNGLYTCFFSAYDKEGKFQSIGKATFRVKEIVR